VTEGEIGVVQPGFSKDEFERQLAVQTATAQSLRQLFGMLSDTSRATGRPARILASP
jgi:hypothetical protein